MKIFIINLKRSLERKKLMQKQIERFFENYPNLKDEINFEFFEAIDAKIKENMEKFASYFPKFRSLTFCGRGGGCGILDTELACFASHLSLWQKCVELNEAILILEDDFYFEGGGGLRRIS
ncbi:glycosyltransferase family 25 protein [Campylobacter upsaliensis]|uniref:glycosyltransferase family 25 protein n=1 Tax=Campylobacter upsaliensis TaxID=28080 RepID=UPI001BD9FB92|nr:glycosyltransferase family 25 protein [Campylobacter upsaliensis]EIZ9324066.1 glycosyltransferase family 25 protein [Campylobacter upsaliensis]EMD0005358.1 glycosyltransferase family 25 protein [Campylobacter upsaliensis]MBT0744167.1 glycosyltransferase family 25 protein [Campylobacter upsaliensis]MBT0799644.1 glycosyltransferase family 25 protein [Campylobacter upsaliensis]MEB2799766.1 glycosyltransferase family 25 protein [Campylobacter upsaliensis]